ncbi:PQQ-binding-like beta-propeller repeat protein [Qipengyuania sp. DSG2-2]|uniref:outer membrane protein assembly factor BamB family protein n=1 Tax=Qipengyuania sp. DGS2-2 TaxID=3349631 RepID=UPI0036D3386E
MTNLPKGRLLVTALLAGSLGACSGGLFGGGGDDKDTPTIGNRMPVLSRIDQTAQVDPELAGVSVVLPPAQTNTEWTQAGGNPAKSYGHLTLGAAPQKIWSANTAGTSNRKRLGAAPIVAAGAVFSVDTDGVIHAFDAQTGAKRWTTRMEIPGDIRQAAFGGGVAFSGGKLFATNGVGQVLALNAANGEILWTTTPAGPLRDAPTVAFNLVFVMSQDNRIFALDADTGEITWQESGSIAQAGVFGVASPAAGQGTIIAGYSSGELSAYRYENGRVLWSDALARTSISTEVGSLTDIDADPIIDQGRVYALGQGGRMAAYELVTGQRIWELNLAGISTPAIAGEWIFTLTDDARMLAIARSTGKVRWITQLAPFRNVEKKKNPIFWTGPVLAGGSLWVASSEGEIYQLSVGEGSASLFQDLNAGVSLPPVVANNTMYILDDSGTIHAFR